MPVSCGANMATLICRRGIVGEAHCASPTAGFSKTKLFKLPGREALQCASAGIAYISKIQCRGGPLCPPFSGIFIKYKTRLQNQDFLKRREDELVS